MMRVGKKKSMPSSFIMWYWEQQECCNQTLFRGKPCTGISKMSLFIQWPFTEHLLCVRLSISLQVENETEFLFSFFNRFPHL